MAMTMNGEYQLPVSRETVWAMLNDTETLKACIPGCELFDKLSDTEFQAVAVTKIGPVKARFKGKVMLSDLDPPNGYKISGQGDGGVAGFASGGATVKRESRDGGTSLTYTVEAQIGGKLAQPGQRLVNGAAKKLADEFFRKIRRLCKPAERLNRWINNKRVDSYSTRAGQIAGRLVVRLERLFVALRLSSSSIDLSQCNSATNRAY